MSATPLRLSLPTSTTQEGPRFCADGRQAVVEYDCQKDDGSMEWSTVVFEDVLQFEFRPAPCCTTDDVVDATEVRVLTTSQRLTTMLERWQEAVGWQEWQQKQGGSARYKHFTMFFDDAGCIDVIAARCRPSPSR